jgi:hypothetical protein
MSDPHDEAAAVREQLLDQIDAANESEESTLTISEHWHIIAVQDHGTGREWWTIRTNQYDRGEAEQQARQLLTEHPHDQADGNPWDDDAETGDDHPDFAWWGIWLTSCSGPCMWAEPVPGYIWTLPPSGQPWWHADGTRTPEPRRTGNVTLSTIVPATKAGLKFLTLTRAELAELLDLGLTDLFADDWGIREDDAGV